MGKLRSIREVNAQSARAIRVIEPEPAPRPCTICGRLVPALLIPSGRYIERRCECERVVRRQNQEEQEHKALMKRMATHTYHGWLGDAWVNPKMVKELGTKKFETYDTARAQDHNLITSAYKYIIKQQAQGIKKETPDTLSEETIATIMADYERFDEHRRTWQNALVKAQSFAAHPQGVLLLYGPFGLGKTHLLAAICNEQRHHNPSMSSLFVVTPTFFRAVYDRMQHTHDEWQLIQQSCTTPLLVFDDLDKLGPKEFRQEVFYQIIDERITAKLPIAISTNKMETLESYVGEAAYSRLMSGCKPVELAGNDYRLNLMQK